MGIIGYRLGWHWFGLFFIFFLCIFLFALLTLVLTFVIKIDNGYLSDIYTCIYGYSEKCCEMARQ